MVAIIIINLRKNSPVRKQRHYRWVEYSKNHDHFPEKRAEYMLSEKNTWLSHMILNLNNNSNIHFGITKVQVSLKYLIEPPVWYVVKEGDALMNLIHTMFSTKWHKCCQTC